MRPLCSHRAPERREPASSIGSALGAGQAILAIWGEIGVTAVLGKTALIPISCHSLADPARQGPFLSVGVRKFATLSASAVGLGNANRASIAFRWMKNGQIGQIRRVAHEPPAQSR